MRLVPAEVAQPHVPHLAGVRRVACVGEVPARFGGPAGAPPKVPAVLILHGSGGVDGRGAFYAQALQDAGIATLEITMFRPAGPLGLTFGIATGIAVDRLPRQA